MAHGGVVWLPIRRPCSKHGDQRGCMTVSYIPLIVLIALITRHRNSILPIHMHPAMMGNTQKEIIHMLCDPWGNLEI